MPAIIASLHNKVNQILYPETVIGAVHMPDGKRTLEAELEEIADGSCTISFEADGSIVQTMTNSGMIITTEFGQADGQIVETCEYPDHTLYYTQTTTFNNDGTITVDKAYADNTDVPNEESAGGGE